MKKILFLGIVLLFITSCDKLDNTQYLVQPDLQYFVNEFYKEANIRGVHLQNHNLIIQSFHIVYPLL